MRRRPAAGRHMIRIAPTAVAASVAAACLRKRLHQSLGRTQLSGRLCMRASVADAVDVDGLRKHCGEDRLLRCADRCDLG